MPRCCRKRRAKRRTNMYFPILFFNKTRCFSTPPIHDNVIIIKWIRENPWKSEKTNFIRKTNTYFILKNAKRWLGWDLNPHLCALHDGIDFGFEAAVMSSKLRWNQEFRVCMNKEHEKLVRNHHNEESKLSKTTKVADAISIRLRYRAVLFILAEPCWHPPNI